MDIEKSAQAVEMFQLVQRYMGLTEEPLDPPKLIETAVQLIDISITCAELRSELYIQLIKQSNSPPNLECRQRVWELWLIAAATFDPSKVHTSASFRAGFGVVSRITSLLFLSTSMESCMMWVSLIGCGKWSVESGKRSKQRRNLARGEKQVKIAILC